MKPLLSLLICILSLPALAQHAIVIRVSGPGSTPVPHATVIWKEGPQTVIADSNGMARFTNISAGPQTFIISHTGFEEQQHVYTFPLASPEISIELEEAGEHEEEIIISATRTSRTITNTPTRIEVISGEELAEKGNMKPGDIRMLLNESTGIQTQQTSATSFNAGIRIQGLDGRYTQLLRDGYPLYAGFSGGLSIMQIAPLDLKQVEVIKGSSSTLYGGGAIAGLVNLVSKTPGEAREISFLANGTSAGGLDLSGFYSERYGRSGLTLFASRNSNAPFDPADIGLTAIPKFERYTINPRLFLYGKRWSGNVGVGLITENRTGGSMRYIKENTPGYFEKNNTDRITGQTGIAYSLKEGSTLQLKNSYSRFNRKISIPGFSFEALQQSSFAELTWTGGRDNSQWVGGLNLLTDDLQQTRFSTDPLLDYHHNTMGAFIQNTWSPREEVTLETGFRADHTDPFGWEWLPRFSVLWRVSPKFTTRLGGGVGYKLPTVFTEEVERLQFRYLLPVDEQSTVNERSVGGNWDLNYTTSLGEVELSLNHLFFYTRLRRPITLSVTAGGDFQLVNGNGYLDTKGMETNLKLLYKDFKLFVGYTYTDANTHANGNKEWLPLTARHRLNNVLMYEKEEQWKLGLEAYHFSRQRLTDGTSGKSYWIMGFMAEKLWEHFSLFVNFENFTNTRQSRFDSIYMGTIDNPVFRDIYAPVEGFVVNGGIKLRL